MSENSTHVEGLEFRATDVNASSVGEKIGHAFERVKHAAEGAREKVGETVREFAMGSLAAMGLGFGLHSVYEKAKEANLEMDRVRKSVAGAQFGFQGWRPGISQIDKMTHSMKQASDITEELEGMEVKLRTPLEELGQTFSQVAALGYSKLGMNQKQVVELTEEMTAAAKVYGISGSEAVSTVTRAMMTGRIRGFGPFQMAMKEALDISSAGKKMKGAVNTEEMFKKLEKGLKGMVPVAQKVGDNMAGSMFEAHALVNKMLEDLGGPIFREQSKSLSEWVQKIRTVKEDGKSLVTIYGEKVASAFNTIKSATVFIASHWKILLGMFAASKLSGALAGMASKGGSAGGVAGALGAVGAMNVTASVVNVNGSGIAGKVGAEMAATLRPGMSDTIGKLAGLAGKALMVTEALGGLYVAADGLAKWIDSKQTEGLQKGRNAGAFLTATHNFERSVKALQGGRGAESREVATASMKSAFAAMGMKQGQKFTAEGVGGMLAALPSETAMAMVRQMNYLMPQMVHKTTAGGLAAAPTEIGREIAAAMNEYSAALFAGEKEFDPNKRKHPGSGNVNIQNLTITQDFKEADPDRVFHKVTNEISGLANSPGTSRLHVRGGV
jgi:archaellum component FlaC